VSQLSILFIVPAPKGISPGQRFRHEQYLSLLQRNGIAFRINTFFEMKGWKTLYTRHHTIRKVYYVMLGLLKRFFTLFELRRYTHIYIYREATPVGLPFFEWAVSRIFKKKIIYDFDDAIWLPVTSEFNKRAAIFRNFSKVGSICRYSWKVSVGNRFLADYANKYNPQTFIIPTVVDTESVHSLLQDQNTKRPAIGWTGSFSTLTYLNIILPVLSNLEKEYDFDFIVIADKDPQLPLKNYRFIKWSRENEAKDLLNFHIGVMPLYDDEISRGKCGFKAIQYMSLGIPALVSPVGVNTEIVEHGINGFVCNNTEEWQKHLELLLSDAGLRMKMGQASRKTIVERYSVKANEQLFLDLFEINL